MSPKFAPFKEVSHAFIEDRSCPVDGTGQGRPVINEGRWVSEAGGTGRGDRLG